ncbi:MAG: bifunctional phosphoribosylaminoimidazolecarboxamide formyltransferase/IMP cyclohydrolase, partial [Phycisphaerae bacterium]
MADRKIQRALISVYDKRGVVELGRALVAEFGVEILSTGGTAETLRNSDIPVTLVEEVTGCGEMLDGRVKTLHPHIHAAILADRDNAGHMAQLARAGIRPIDLVVVNLYPFEKTVADPACDEAAAIEMIDIGGPCLLRAAAKNHRHVLLVTDPDRYGATLEHLRETGGQAVPNRSVAAAAFGAVSRYDRTIAAWLGGFETGGATLSPFGPVARRRHVRYGENPHQQAELLIWDANSGGSAAPGFGDDASAAEMSFNNHVDAGAAAALCGELTRELASYCATRGGTTKQGATGAGATYLHACVFIKHTNACGVGVAEDPADAYARAYLGDPNAAMGGVLACSFDVDATLAEAVMNTYDRWGKKAGAGGFFVEVWVAGSFSDEARQVIRGAKPWGQRVRLLSGGGVGGSCGPSQAQTLETKNIAGGMLVQTCDDVGLGEASWRVVTRRAPTEAELDDLRLAWLVCKHTKSNAISLCKDRMLIGNGAGQMSRVMSCRIATWLAKENG